LEFCCGDLASSLWFGLPLLRLQVTRILFLMATLTQSLWACPVCSANDEKTLTAYLLTTALMIFVPLTFLGVFGWWIYRSLKSQAQ